MFVEPIGTTRAVERTDARHVRRAARVLFAATLAALIAGCASPPRGG
jgi:hypothetical protein